MSRPNLSIDTEINEACDTMTVWDTTDDYGGGTVTTASVTSVIVIARNKTTGTYITYTFTVGTNVITAATISLDGGTPTDILSELSSTAWPFIVDVNEFDLFADYGVTLPDFDDAVYQIEYTIAGEVSDDRGGFVPYSYTTSKATLKSCDTCCCISKMFASIDPDCDCGDKSIKLATEMDAWLKVAIAAANLGQTEKAVEALTKAKEMCDCHSNCNDC